MEKYVYEPIKLHGERVWRTYIGGREIGYLHGDMDAEDNHFPEEWMYSATQARNAGREDIEEGLCKLARKPEMTLKQLIEMYPNEMLGGNHVKQWGNTPGVLIKMIDSLERLTIQVHPDKERAERLFQSRFGKTECWHILETREEAEEVPCIYLGFKEGIEKEDWVKCFETQDYDKMLGMLNRMEVNRGETYLVKGGLPHAIGSGCLIMEIQEPTDYTIRVEKVTPSGFVIDDIMCHQGLGFQRMFECFDYTGLSLEQGKEIYRIKTQEIPWEFGRKQMLVGYGDTSCFQIERLQPNGACEMSGEGVFFCLYIVSGQRVLKTGTQEYQLKKNDQFFIPAESGAFVIESSCENPISILMMKGPEDETTFKK